MQMPDGVTSAAAKPKFTLGMAQLGGKAKSGGRAGKVQRPTEEPFARMRKRAHNKIALTNRLAAVTPWCVVVLIGGGAAAGAVHYRNDIVAAWPKSASVFAAVGQPANLYGLDIRNIQARTALDAKGRRIMVRGEIASISRKDEAVPYLKVRLVDVKGVERVSWMVDPKIEVLKTGGKHVFVTSHASNLQGDVRALIAFAEPPLKIPRPPPEPPTGDTGLMGAELPKGMRARVEAEPAPLEDLPVAQARPAPAAHDDAPLTAR
jgi:hypothetical protein